MKASLAIMFMLLGAVSVLAFEESILPRIQNGWNTVDDTRHEYCKHRSRKWYRKVTFQVQRTYTRCMENEI